MKALSILLLFFAITSCSNNLKTGKTLSPSTDPEVVANYQAVYAAISDYVEGIYEVAPERIERSVDTDLHKLGYYYNPEQEKYLDNLPMTYDQLYNLAANWNREGEQADENSAKDIVVFEVNDKTASAKLTAKWGIDYFHLAKVDGQWKIKNILWQSPPR